MKTKTITTIILGCLIGLYQPLYSQDNIENGHEYVDLGLPSGLKWATCNVGANAPEQYGTFFAWGEITPKDEYTEANSLTYNMSLDDISGNAEYDVATARWGGDWRMPTNTELQELIDNCTWNWTELNDVKGYLLIGPNGNNIFLPAAGYRSSNYTNGTCGNTYYYSSTPNSDNAAYAYALGFSDQSYSMIIRNYRCNGYVIRPVKNANAEAPFVTISAEHFTDISIILKIYASSPEVNITERGFYWGTNPEVGVTDNKVVLDNTAGYITKALVDLEPNTTYYLKAYAANSEGTSYSEIVSFTTLAETEYNDYVDLGLPSGLKWATYNIGATSPEEYGDYYAWGEVSTKETYSSYNSQTYGESMSDISATEYDAATVNWGGHWRMPTKAEINELISNCTCTWTQQGGKNGCKVTGPNGNSIFLPAADYRDGSSLVNDCNYGFYWSSSPYESNSRNAYYLFFGSDSQDLSSHLRYYGLSVRPVLE